MAKHKRTEAILDQAIDILANYHPMTVRQVYYQLQHAGAGEAVVQVETGCQLW